VAARRDVLKNMFLPYSSNFVHLQSKKTLVIECERFVYNLDIL